MTNHSKIFFDECQNFGKVDKVTISLCVCLKRAIQQAQNKEREDHIWERMLLNKTWKSDENSKYDNTKAIQQAQNKERERERVIFGKGMLL